MNEKTRMILSLYDGTKTSGEIAEIVGLSPRYVRKVAKKYDLRRLGAGARQGKNNHQFVSGRRIDFDGYVLVTAPQDHPYARQRKNRKGKVIFEHRLVLEQKLGHYMLPEEVVDHIDGLTLHNDPSNLRLFAENGDHLHETIKGLPKQISVSGLRNILTRFDRHGDFQRVDTYYRRRVRGDVRLRQILLAALKLGIDSPFLWGTHRHLKRIGIDPTSRPSLECALDELLSRWEADLAL